MAPSAPARPRAIDLTGYWVSVITEDWKFRMVTPRKGVYETLHAQRRGRARSATAGTRRATRPRASSAAPMAPRNIMRMPGAAACHVGRRQHAADRHRRRHPDPAARFVASTAASGATVVAGPLDGGVAVRAGGRGADPRRQPEGGHHEPARRLRPQERRAPQRQGRGDGVLRPQQLPTATGG